MIVGETLERRDRAAWSPLSATRQMQGYYHARPCAEEIDWTQTWGVVTDPDGRRKDRQSESARIEFLSYVQEEIDFVNGLEPGLVLDIGCGPGWFLDAIHPQWSRFGTEPAALPVHKTKTYDVRHELYPPQQGFGLFDVIFCHHVIEHMPDPLDALAHMRRQLNPGGWLILGTPDFASPCALRFGENYRMLHDPTHVSLFTAESMHRLLRDYGFTIERVRHPFPDHLATPENFARWHDTSKVSPPWPGNWITFYARRRHGN